MGLYEYIPVSIAFIVYIVSAYIFSFYSTRQTKKENAVALSVSNLLLGCTLIILLTPWFNFSYRLESIFNETLKLILAFFIADSAFYWSHRLVHTPFFYDNYHKFHHMHVNPIPWTALYVHPGEFIIAFVGIFLLPIALFQNVWFITASIFWSVIMYSLVSSHSSEGSHHDIHHQTLKGHFGSRLGIWDSLIK
jgi:sterol desaturase/sphingolipid hydroxylase (fatty acid hydroxylase superfamily)